MLSLLCPWLWTFILNKTKVSALCKVDEEEQSSIRDHETQESSQEPESWLCRPGTPLPLTPSLPQLQESATNSLVLVTEKAIRHHGIGPVRKYSHKWPQDPAVGPMKTSLPCNEACDFASGKRIVGNIGGSFALRSSYLCSEGGSGSLRWPSASCEILYNQYKWTLLSGGAESPAESSVSISKFSLDCGWDQTASNPFFLSTVCTKLIHILKMQKNSSFTFVGKRFTDNSRFKMISNLKWLLGAALKTEDNWCSCCQKKILGRSRHGSV